MYFPDILRIEIHRKSHSVSGIRVLQINHQAGHFGIQDQECDNSSCWPIGFCLLADHKAKIKLYLPDLLFFLMS